MCVREGEVFVYMYTHTHTNTHTYIYCIHTKYTEMSLYLVSKTEIYPL